MDDAASPAPAAGVYPPLIYSFEFPSAAASSSFLSKKRSCFGPCINTFPTHDPTFPPRIFNHLQPTEQSVAEVMHDKGALHRALCAMSVIFADGKALNESSTNRATRTVQSEVMSSNKPYLLDGVQLVENKTLGFLQQPVVYCKLGGNPNIAWAAKIGGLHHVAAIQEVKQASASPLVGLQQAGVYACAAVAGLYKAGVDLGKILVPMSVCTGVAEVHGAAYMAYPSFPVAVSTSGVLDLRTDRGAATAHLHRKLASQQMERTLQLLVHLCGLRSAVPAQISSSEATIEADDAAWFQPSFSLSQVWMKIGGVSHGLAPERDAVLARMALVFTELHASPASRFVCFPICFANDILPPGFSKNGLSALLFPNLTTHGYRSGLPEDVVTARMYVAAVKEATTAMHNAGVIHGDMYVSNIMWRLSSTKDAVEVKLIDWDTAFIARDGLPQGSRQAWKNTCKWRLYETGKPYMDEEVNLRLLDSFMVDTLEHFCSESKQLWCEWLKASGKRDVRHLNIAFNRMQALYVRHKGWAETATCRKSLSKDDGQVTGSSSNMSAAFSAPAISHSDGSVAASDDAEAPAAAKKARAEP